MFDLEKAIEIWRQELAASGVRQRAILELETHLRDHLEAQLAEGRSPEDAFKIVKAQLGQPAEIVREFAKLNDLALNPSTRIFRISCFLAAPIMIGAAAPSALERDLAIGQKLIEVIPLGLAAIYVGSLPLFYRRLPEPRTFVARALFKIVTLIFALLPIVALMDAVRLIDLNASYPAVMFFSYLYVAMAFTILAFACRSGRGGQRGHALNSLQMDELDAVALAALNSAADQARSLGHDFIGTEHILLGVLENPSDLLRELLAAWNIDAHEIREAITQLVHPNSRTIEKELPYTPRARSAFRFAEEAAERLRHDSVHVEHLLLGLLKEPEGVAGIVLRKSGLHFARAKADILRGWRDGGEGPALVTAT